MATRGRKSDHFEIPDGTVKDRLEAVLNVWPELRPRFHKSAAVAARMAPYWARDTVNGPNISTISSQLNDNRRTTLSFVRALHASLPLGPLVDVSEWKRRLADFTVFVRQERHDSVLRMFRGIAEKSPFIAFDKARRVLGGLGRPVKRGRPAIPMGSEQHLVVTMPLRGFLTVLNFGPSEFGGMEFLWLDHVLGVHGKELETETIVIPDRKSGIPVGGPVAAYSLIAIVTRNELPLRHLFGVAEFHDDVPEISESRIHNFFLAVTAISGRDRSVCILEHEVTATDTTPADDAATS
jgi:hypothetical protein